jgi:hypothetical protein
MALIICERLVGPMLLFAILCNRVPQHVYCNTHCIYNDWLFLCCLCGAYAQCPRLLLSVLSGTPASSLFSTFYPQALVKFGSEEERTAVFDELRPHILELARNTYGHFIVLRMLDRANKEQLQHIMNALHGQVVSLLRHPSGSAGEEVDSLDARLALENCASFGIGETFPSMVSYLLSS